MDLEKEFAELHELLLICYALLSCYDKDYEDADAIDKALVKLDKIKKEVIGKKILEK